MNAPRNIVSTFCSPDIQEKISHIYNSLKEKNLLPKNINLEQDSFNINDKNLFFGTFNKNNERSLQNLVSKINFKKCHIIIISNDKENYFDFAIEYDICNIIHTKKLDENVFLGILKRFFNNDLGLEPFFDRETNVFDKQYFLSGNICMYNLIEKVFADFIDKIKNTAKSTFIINCHELVTNAFAYGVLKISPDVRDEKIYDVGKSIDIPEDKAVKVHLLMDKNFYGISVTDLGGTLTIQRILERIRRQSVVAGESIPMGIGDYTGRGLAILSRHGLLTFSIKSGEYTSVSLISNVKTHYDQEPISILATEV
jgi:hypothetical protein